jgi:hypothetical protein
MTISKRFLLTVVLLLYGLALVAKNISVSLTIWSSPSPYRDDPYYPSSPLLSNESFVQRTQRTSPACEPNFPPQKIQRIYFTHMRKAGGTTLRHYLRKVARHYSIHPQEEEAGPDELPGTRNDTLYITHMRDPVNRSMSHFRYEGRWSCPDLMNSSFEPSYENAYALQDWVRTEFQGSNWTARLVHTGKTCKRKMWLCSANCYIKWLNWKKGRCVRELRNRSYFETTIDTLYQYHMIIDVEQLFWNPDYAKRLERFFGVPGLDGLQASARCDKPSKMANKRYPLQNVSTVLLDELRERNRLDLEVYDQFISSCNGKMNFPPERTFSDMV